VAKNDTRSTDSDQAATAVDPAAPAPGSKRKAPEPVHGPDSLMDRILPHIKKIAVGGIALFAVIGIYVGWRYMKSRGQAKDTMRLNAALAIAQAPIVAADATPPAKPKADNEKTYPSAAERATAALAELSQAGGASEKSALYQAALLMDAGKLDDAEKVYKAHSGDEGLDGALAREGVGYVLEARAAASKDAAEQQKLLEQALEAFKQMQPDDKGPRRDYALYDQARILAQLNKRAEAKATLEAALKASPESEIKGDIQAQIARVEGP
jgi:tetratricopeptide (TPR) repeat protein